MAAVLLAYFFALEVGGEPEAFLPGSFYSSCGDIPSNINTTQVSRSTVCSVETITVRDNTSMAVSGRRFLRVKISHQ